MVNELNKLLGCIPNVDTSAMPHEAWIAKRREGIGGSDAGAVMQMNNFASPLTIYLEKKGLVAPFAGNKATKRGTRLEPVIRNETLEDFPSLVIQTVPYMFSHPEYPFMKANVDGLVFAKDLVEINSHEAVRGLGGHEIKSAKTDYGWKEDEIPDSYYCQVQHYMAVLGLPWFLVSVYILDNEDVRHYVIRRNEEFIKKLIAAETDFWDNYIVPGVMPAATGIENEEDMITGMFQGGAPVTLGDAEKELCREYVEASAVYNEAKKTKERVAAELKVILVQKQSADGEKKISATAGTYSISWSRFPRKDIDREAMKRDGIYDQYAVVSESGRLTITEKKSKEAA